MTAILVTLMSLSVAILLYLIFRTVSSLRDFINNEVLYKSYINYIDLATVEENLDRLRRVIVMADRVDEPTDKLREAVEENLADGVQYLFLVSHRTAESTLGKYRRMFEQLEIAVRARDRAKVIVGKSPTMKDGSLSEFHKLKQDWIDYPYICYEYEDKNNPDMCHILMYRGDEIGVGIAANYQKIDPKTAYSLVSRADALKQYIKSEPEQFTTGSDAGLSNVLPLRPHNGAGKRAHGTQTGAN